VAGCCKFGDEPLGSFAIELVSYGLNDRAGVQVVLCRFLTWSVHSNTIIYVWLPLIRLFIIFGSMHKLLQSME
jgi:hypothetical protein